MVLSKHENRPGMLGNTSKKSNSEDHPNDQSLQGCKIKSKSFCSAFKANVSPLSKSSSVPKELESRYDGGEFAKVLKRKSQRISLQPYCKSNSCNAINGSTGSISKIYDYKQRCKKEMDDDIKYPKTSSATHVGNFAKENMAGAKNIRTDEILNGPKHKSVTLNDKVYVTFRTALTSTGIPEYIRMSYLDKENNCIFIGVAEGKTEKAYEYIQVISPDLVTAKMFTIQEIGEVNFGGSKHRDLAAKSTITDENSAYKSQPGQMLPNIQGGKLIKCWNTDVVKAVENNSIQFQEDSNSANKSNGGMMATLGCVMKDSKTELLYGLTAMHVYSTEEGFRNGDMHTFCEIHKKGDEKDNPQKKNASIVQLCHTSDKFLGMYGGSPHPINGYTCAIDIAAFPIMEHLQEENIIDHTFPATSGNISVYRGNSDDMKGRAVQQIGAMSGVVKGTIIVAKFDIYVKQKWLGDDCFLVASDHQSFAKLGDSGAIIYDDENSVTTNSMAYGVLFFVEKPCFRKSPVTEKPYEAIAWCTRLDYGLNVIKENTKINLNFVIPPSLEPRKSRSLSNNLASLTKSENDLCNPTHVKLNPQVSTSENSSLGNLKKVMTSVCSPNNSTSSLNMGDAKNLQKCIMFCNSEPHCNMYQVTDHEFLNWLNISKEETNSNKLQKRRATSDPVFSVLGVNNTGKRIGDKIHGNNESEKRKTIKGKVAKFRAWILKQASAIKRKASRNHSSGSTSDSLFATEDVCTDEVF